MNRRITGFHRDEEGDWVAELECGHGQHVRHNPPWTARPWTMTSEGRASMLGHTLNCRLCNGDGPRPADDDSAGEEKPS